MAVRVDIREFKAHLEAYLRRVKAGEVVEMVERGKPIGRLIPEGKSVAERLQAMAQKGWVVLPREKFRPCKPVAQVKGRKTVAELLVKDRR